MMRSLVCRAPGRLVVAPRPVPVRDADAVLVGIRHARPCGADQHIVTGDQPFLSCPRPIAHALAGEGVDVPVRVPDADHVTKALVSI